MSVKKVEVGDYDIQDYSMLSWYLYVPVLYINLAATLYC